MKATQSPLWLTLLVASTMLTGCGYSAMPIAPLYNDNLDNPRLVRQQTMPTLPKGVTARGLSMDPAKALVRVGESMRFNISIKGSDNKTYSDGRLVTWTVSNPQLGAVDMNGVLVPSQAGSLKVIATIGGVSAEATLDVEPARYAWQQVLSPSGADLHAVKMVTRYEAWAGGDHGTMLRFINGAWHPEPSFTQKDANIRGLGFANTNLGWAVGNRSNGELTFVSRWNGAFWQAEKLPVTEGTVNAVSVLNDRDVWAVGQESGGDALILHYDGFSWKHVQAPAHGKINDVQMLSPQRGWAVGKYGSGNIPLIFKYEGGEWKKSGIWDNRGSFSVVNSLELNAIKMVSETQGYAVGTRDNLLTSPRGLFLTFDPKRNGWVPGEWDAKVKDLDQVPLYDVEMISGTEGWALGEVRQPDYNFERNPKSIFGNLLANAGGVLKVDTNYFSGNLSGAFYAIDLLPQGEGFVVGQNGYILQRTYDWRGISQNGGYGSSGGYGDPYGGSSGGYAPNNPVTYGPGGSQVPGTQKQSMY